MQPTPPAVVALPVTDRPAIEDPRAAAIQAFLRNLLVSPLLTAAGAGVVWVLFTVLDVSPRLRVVLLVLLLGLTALLIGLAAWTAPKLLRSRDLLRRERWRPVAATVLGLDGGHFVVAADGKVLRLPEVRAKVAHRVVGRTGRLWLVGPAPSGAVVALIDGFGILFHGREVERPATLTPVSEEIHGADGVAADDPLVRDWAKETARMVRYRVWPHLIAFAMVALILFGFWLSEGLSVVPGVVALVVLAIFLPIQLVQHRKASRRFQPWTTLPDLLRAGPWQPVGITLAPWRPDRYGANHAQGTVRLADGRVLPIQLPDANLDLVGNIQQVHGLWVAGDPVPGKLFAVGYPGYPILGLATFD